MTGCSGRVSKLLKDIRDCKDYIKYLQDNKRKFVFTEDVCEQVDWWMTLANDICADLTDGPETLETVYEDIMDMSRKYPMPKIEVLEDEDNDSCGNGDTAEETFPSADDESSLKGNNEPEGIVRNPLYQENRENSQAGISVRPTIGVGRGRGVPPPQRNGFTGGLSHDFGSSQQKPVIGRGRGFAQPMGHTSVPGPISDIRPFPSASQNPDGIGIPHPAFTGNAVNSPPSYLPYTLPSARPGPYGAVYSWTSDPRRTPQGPPNQSYAFNEHIPPCPPRGEQFQDPRVRIPNLVNVQDPRQNNFSGMNFQERQNNFRDANFPDPRQNNFSDLNFPDARQNNFRDANFQDPRQNNFRDVNSDPRRYYDRSHPDGFRNQGSSRPNGIHYSSYVNFPGGVSVPPGVSATSSDSTSRFVGNSSTNLNRESWTSSSQFDNPSDSYGDHDFSSPNDQYYSPPRANSSLNNFRSQQDRFRRPVQPSSSQNNRRWPPSKQPDRSSENQLRQNTGARNNSRTPGTPRIAAAANSQNRRIGISASLCKPKSPIQDKDANAAKNVKTSNVTPLKDIRREVPTELYRLGTKDKHNRVQLTKVPAEEVVAKLIKLKLSEHDKTKPTAGSAGKKTTPAKKAAATTTPRKAVTSSKSQDEVDEDDSNEYDDDESADTASRSKKSAVKIKLPFNKKSSARKAPNSKASDVDAEDGPPEGTVRSAAKRKAPPKKSPAKRRARVIYSDDEDDGPQKSDGEGNQPTDSGQLTQRDNLPQLTVHESGIYNTEDLWPFLEVVAIQVFREHGYCDEGAQDFIRRPEMFESAIQTMEEGFRLPEQSDAPEPDEEKGGRKLRPRIPSTVKLSPRSIKFLNDVYKEIISEVKESGERGEIEPQPSTSTGSNTARKGQSNKLKEPTKTKTQKAKTSAARKKASGRQAAAPTKKNASNKRKKEEENPLPQRPPANLFNGPGIERIPAAILPLSSTLPALAGRNNGLQADKVSQESPDSPPNLHVKLEVKLEVDEEGHVELPPPEVLQSLNLERDV